MADSTISEPMRDAIGRTFRHATSFPVAASDIRKWAIAVYYPAPPPAVFWDEQAAAASVHGGIVAPEDFNPFAWMTTAGPDDRSAGEPNDPDNTEHLLGIAGPGLKFQLNGGLDVEYGVPIRPGDVISTQSRVVEYRERRGRLGLMLFTVIEDVWTNQNDETVRRGRTTLIRY
ncbi:MaoC family dehydratase N-terminal domain-containing protein [Streptomyces sp. NPDC059373]